MRKFITKKLQEWGFIYDGGRFEAIRKDLIDLQESLKEEMNTTVKTCLQNTKTVSSELSYVSKEFDKKIAANDRRISQVSEDISKRIGETNLAIKQTGKELDQHYSNMAKETTKDLVQMRKQLVAFENAVRDYSELPAQMQNFLKNIEGYKKSFDKTVDLLSQTVEENKQKVDKFDETYRSMIRTSNRNAGKMNSQSWDQNGLSDHNN